MFIRPASPAVRDLFDRRVSLYEYRELFNHFAEVTFPVSTLAPDAGGELVAYSWIFPNVLPMGHWWYSNVPALHRGRPESKDPGPAEGQAAGVLFRCLQARVHPAQVQHVPADPGGDSGRGSAFGAGVGRSIEPYSLAKSSCLTIPEEYLGETAATRAPRFDLDRKGGHVLATDAVSPRSDSARTRDHSLPGLTRSHDRSR